MKKYIISGDKGNIENFMDNANWIGFFNSLHCVMACERIDDNRLLLSFSLPRHYMLDIPTEKEKTLAEMIEKECKSFNVTPKEEKEC